MLDLTKAAAIPTVVVRWLIMPAIVALGWGWWAHQKRLDETDRFVVRVMEQRTAETLAIKELADEVRAQRVQMQENARKQEQWAIEILRSARR